MPPHIAPWDAQETGRAGRDGQLASAIMYYSYADAKISRYVLSEITDALKSTLGCQRCCCLTAIPMGWVSSNNANLCVV